MPLLDPRFRGDDKHLKKAGAGCGLFSKIRTCTKENSKKTNTPQLRANDNVFMANGMPKKVRHKNQNVTYFIL